MNKSCKGQHELTNEKEYFKWGGNFEGDTWCKKCDYVAYSREAKRMEYFSLYPIANPTRKNE